MQVCCATDIPSLINGIPRWRISAPAIAKVPVSANPRGRRNRLSDRLALARPMTCRSFTAGSQTREPVPCSRRGQGRAGASEGAGLRHRQAVGEHERQFGAHADRRALGTAEYMSPEQCLGVPSGIDHRTDIYALGTILYEMLCGQVPFVREGFGEILIGQIFEDPPSLRTRLPEIPESLERVVLRALAKNPEERFAFMQDFAQAVHEAVPGSARTAKPDEHHAFQPLGRAPLTTTSTNSAQLHGPSSRIVVAFRTGRREHPQAAQVANSILADHRHCWG